MEKSIPILHSLISVSYTHLDVYKRQVFDTGKKMKDFVGKTATQQEASLIAKQIKSNKMGTKGIIVYSQDGSPGSGRRFTAQAIAGEARVPYIEVNTCLLYTSRCV